MKKNSFIHRAVTAPVFCVSALLLMATAQDSKAAITVSFNETGGNVVATISGSLDLTGLVRNLDNYVGSRGVGNYATDKFLQIGVVGDGGTSDRYTNGVATASGLTTIPTAHTITESFGFSIGQIYVPGATALNATDYTPAAGMTMTWTSKTLADIGLGALTTTPKTVWNNPNAIGTAGSIQFVVVPEASSPLLLGLACLGLISRRKR